MNDTIPLPAELADDLVLYRGRWLTETRQPVSLKGAPNSVLREIWVRLPSGKDRKWRTSEPEFSALEGHRVGALVRVGYKGKEALLGMVNYDTDEMRMFWFHQRPGFGCALWGLWLFCALLVERGGEKALYTWLVAFVVLVILTIRKNGAIRRYQAAQCSCLDLLRAAGPGDS